MLSHNDLKNLALLKQKKHQDATRKFLIEGARLVIEALRSDWVVEMLLHTADFSSHTLSDQILDLGLQKGIQTEALTKPAFKKISQTVHSQGIIAVVHQKQQQQAIIDLWREDHFTVVAIENLQDPGNLGTIMRTAAWFGAAALVLGSGCVRWNNEKALRASMGAAFHLPIFQMEDLCMTIKGALKCGATLYIADQHARESCNDMTFSPKKILLLGGETQGISGGCRQLPNRGVAIPRTGSGESLNVSIAAAVLLAKISEAGHA